MPDLLDALNEEQRKAAENIDGPILIIAGAGSGKTRMITYRIAHMIESGISGKNILALTFTNKAAGEMKERVSFLIGKKSKDVTVTTFHSFGLGILKRYIHLIGYHNDFSLYDQRDNEGLLKDAIMALGYQIKDYNISTLLSYFSDFKTGRKELDSNKDSAVREIYREWLLSQKAYNVVDFDDLIILPIRIFKEKKGVLENVQDAYRYILVDEFQDTSLRQYEMVSLIAEKYRNIAVVGDDDQSIYSWRGANFMNITLFERDFPERKEFKLERNYRSSKTILEAANAIISNNTERKVKTLWTDSAKGTLLYLRHHKNSEEEASFIVQDIRNRARRGTDLGEIGILVRTNALITLIEEKLLENRIPHRISGGKSFYDRKEIRDILSYLKFLINRKDDSALLRIINTPRRGIGRISVEKMRKKSEEKNISLFEALEESIKDESFPERTRKALSDFWKKINEWEKSKDSENIVRKIVHDISYKSMLYEEYEDKEKLIEYKMNGLDFLSERVSSYLRRHAGSTLMDYINAVTLISEDEDESGKVSLMTMHASKGLEFSVVYIAGADDHIIPSKKALEENKDNIEEERRLFYVAVTRAKDILVINTAEERLNSQGEMVLSVPSRFIEEIPQDLFQNEKDLEKNDRENSLNNLRALLNKYKK